MSTQNDIKALGIGQGKLSDKLRTHCDPLERPQEPPKQEYTYPATPSKNWWDILSDNKAPRAFVKTHGLPNGADGQMLHFGDDGAPKWIDSHAHMADVFTYGGAWSQGGKRIDPSAVRAAPAIDLGKEHKSMDHYEWGQCELGEYTIIGNAVRVVSRDRISSFHGPDAEDQFKAACVAVAPKAPPIDVMAITRGMCK